MKMGLIYERKPAEEGGQADLSGLALKTINELGGPGFNDVRVGLDGIAAETAIPEPPPSGMSVAVENLEIF